MLITGAAGSGKSATALQLMALGAVLVADDQVEVTAHGGTLRAHAPDRLRGLIEARGAGLMQVACVPEADLLLAVDLDAESEGRLPHLRQFCITDVCVPLIAAKNLPNLVSLVMAGLRYGTQPLFLDPDA